MNDRQRKIDDFLKFFRDICKQNPDYELNHNNVYSELINLGLPDDEKKKLIEDSFNKWITHFENDPICNVFVSAHWQYFCQFISADNQANNADEHLKVYVPLDSEHVERGAIEIFEFLSNNNISHLSKIGKYIRFDNVVIRLINPEDLKKLLNFIDNNKYIQEGLLPANPFLFSLNGIPLASDGRLSFNSTIADLIKLYINDKAKNNILDTVGVEDFYDFVENYYKNAFSSAQGLKKLAKDFDHSCISRGLVNYKNVFELFLKSSRSDFTLDDYIAHYRECSNSEIEEDQIEKVSNILMGIPQDGVIKNGLRESKKSMSKEEIDALLLQIIDVMTEKYKDQYAVINSIQNYLLIGNAAFITRDRNLRSIVCESTFREDLSQIIKENGTNLISYAQNLLRKEKSSDYITESDVILQIFNILQAMSSEQGYNFAFANLANFIMTGNPMLLTRNFGLRERIVNSSFRSDVLNILQKRKMTISDYLNFISNSDENNKELYFEQAILETYRKYEDKFQRNESNFNGIDFVAYSILKLIKTGNYRGFTRDNNARKNLQDNVSLNDVLEIIANSVGKENFYQISQDEFINTLKQYVLEIIEKRFSKKI